MTGPGTNTNATDTPVRTHAIDRITRWMAVGGTLAFVGLVVLGLDRLSAMVADGHLWLLLGLAVTLAVAASGLVFYGLISPAVGEQLRGMADVAEAIAAGDLSRTPDADGAGGQLGRLAKALTAMTNALRNMTGLLRQNSTETARLSSEITGGTEQMAQAASGIADTASTLSLQASDMADTIRLLSLDATRLTELSGSLSTGARDGLERNSRLKILATENHELLDESARRLDALASDVQESARSTEALASAADQIREFVTLVQKIARQSKLLALNAAMEAARAGEQGEGFTVVANEVRRLAQSTADAAEHTDSLMQDLIAQMERARATSARSLSTVESVRSATEHGRQSFTQVELAVEEAEQSTGAMASSAAQGNALALEITHKLGSLSAGTMTFASAMHDVAAASQQQSASTQEIAAAANALVTAADRVAESATAFRTD